MPVIPTLLLLLLLLSLSSASAAAPLSAVSEFLADDSRRDPLSSDDPFPSLPSNLKHLLATDPPAPIPHLLSRLLSLHLPVPVHVKLAGPFSPAAPALLLSLASAALSAAPFYSLSPSRPLVISHSLHLHPSLSQIAPQISVAIASQLASATPTHGAPSALHPIPYSAVDSIVHADYLAASAASAPGFYIYIINPDPQSKLYAYSHDNQSKCHGSIWSSADRYVWIDLAAGPLDYGPALSGEGLLPRGDFHPLAALRRGPRPERALLADVASLILSAYRSLLVPPLRLPVQFEPALLIQFIHIHNHNAKDSVGLDFRTIELALKERELEFKHQTLDFERYSVKFTDCPACSFAISRASKSFTARFLFENYTLISSEYLDSKVLRQIVMDSSEQLRRLAGIKEEEGLLSRRVIPVYVFDLEYDKLLMLDRHHQAVAFPDMVITVRTRSSYSPSDYMCNSRHVLTETRNLDRPIVGAILQSMWGVAPTHLSWSPEHNSTLVDYTWSVGQTPFGPFLESLSLSFVQKDAARRNVLLTGLNLTVTDLIEVLQSMVAHGGDRKLLGEIRYIEYTRRWNLLEIKLGKLISAMSQLDYDKALYFLRSSDHDIYALHTIVYEATEGLEASLVCFKDSPFPWTSASLTVLFLLALFYIYTKRGKIFKSKRKQF